MKLAFPVRSLLKPSSLSMIAVCLSFGAWLFPTFGVLEKGYENPSRLDLTSGVMLISWYLTIFVSFFFGQRLGEMANFRGLKLKNKLLDLDSNFIYLGFTLLAAIGIGATLVRIFSSLSIREAILYVSLGQANALKDTLYEDYSIGLVSLRYVVLYPASIALDRLIRLKEYSLLNLLNLLLLAVSAFLSSRLILIATLTTTALLVNYGRKRIRLSAAKLGIAATFLFLLLAALNISRNAGYYESKQLSFGVAGLNEMIAYLGTPFQAAIASAKVTDQLAAGGVDAYRNYTELAVNYMTNSAFVHLHEQIGYFSWLYMAAVCSLSGFAFTALSSLGRTVFLLPCGAILYGSAELWRLDLFHQGTFIVWMAVGLGWPASVMLVQHFGGFVQRLYTMHATADPR